jgi:hypothetical protein
MIQQLITGRSIVYTPFRDVRNAVVETNDTSPTLRFAVDERGLISYGVRAEKVESNSTVNCAATSSFDRNLKPIPVNIALAELLTHVTRDHVPTDCLPLSLRLR